MLLFLYVPYSEIMFATENFAHRFHQQLVKVIHSIPPAEIYKEILMPKHDQILMERYRDTFILLLRHISKHDLKLD